jgi:hypothetical protein
MAQQSAYFGSDSIAQETGAVPNPQTRVSMLCKTSAGGPGIALVTLSNLTTSTIPKGKTLFAKKDDETIKFQAADAIPNGGYATYRTDARAFQSDGPCDGWY